MAFSTVPKAKKDGKLTFRDGTGSPVTLEVAYEEGNFSFETPRTTYLKLVNSLIFRDDIRDAGNSNGPNYQVFGY